MHVPARVLVVEDSPSARKLMQALLVRLGVGLPELRIAPTTLDAVRIFTDWHPEIAFVDLELRPPPDRPPLDPDALRGIPVDGNELVRHFLERDPELQIIVCSASDPSLSSVAALIREGRIQGVVKPVRAAGIREVLARAGGALLHQRAERHPSE